ncbi:hypothetical protein HDF15_004465 [Granulicella mallensis]|uniref:Uncharacterized protein n=2 Tax=Granulicella mallensis TaxID=940614 RepID=A0A7W8EAY1_9BACT|nr:hypothetical protein [Granulicella mallensis]
MHTLEAVKVALHNASDLTLLGIILVFVMSATNLALTLFYTWRNTRKTNFINTVTSSRIEWIGSLREKMSNFIATAIALKYIPANDPRAENKRVELDSLRYSIFLHLNPDTEPDKEIQSLVLDLHSGTEATAIVRLRSLTQRYFKNEWERVKDEAEDGRLKAKRIDHKEAASLATQSSQKAV